MPVGEDAGWADGLGQAIRSRAARVRVIGQGYVGLSIAAAAANAGMTVVGIDRDADRIDDLAHGRLVVPGVRESAFAIAVESGRLSFTTDSSTVADAHVVLMCLPTPVVDHRPDLSFIEDAAADLARHMRSRCLVILESTTYPGTTEQVLQPILESSGARIHGRDFLLAYSPERIDPGNAKFDLANTPRVVGGLTPQATAVAADFYSQLVDQVSQVSSARAAELAKLLENTFRMVNIALVNELAVLCGEQGIDPWEVIEAAATKPFGFMAFYPGPGVGGHCIPLDPTYLAWQSRRDAGRPYRLVELAQDINAEMPGYVANRIAEALNDRGKPVRGSRVFALGVTYKPDVGDIRESAAIEVLRRLYQRGATVAFHDPYIDSVDLGEISVEGSGLTDEALASADCVALLTPHSVFDLRRAADLADLLFDARGAARHIASPNVVRL